MCRETLRHPSHVPSFARSERNGEPLYESGHLQMSVSIFQEGAGHGLPYQEK
jgi:hypothetical protein